MDLYSYQQWLVFVVTCHVLDSGLGPLHASLYGILMATQQGRTWGDRTQAQVTVNKPQSWGWKAGWPASLSWCQALASIPERELLDPLVQFLIFWMEKLGHRKGLCR